MSPGCEHMNTSVCIWIFFRSHFGSSCDLRSLTFCDSTSPAAISILTMSVVSVDPSRVEMEGFGDAEAVLKWCGFAGFGDTVTDSFAKAVGMKANTPIRILGAIPRAIFEDVIANNWQIGSGIAEGTRFPSPLEATMGSLAGRVFRLMVGAEKSSAQVEAEAAASLVEQAKAKQHEVELAKLQAEAAKNSPSINAKSDSDGIKLSQVVSQMSEQVAPVLDQGVVDSCYKVYWDIFKRYPGKGHEMTEEQLGALSFLLKSHKNPYVDFAVWIPDATATTRKLKLGGMMPMAGGKWRSLELFGPPDVHMWKASFTLLQAGLLMFEAVDCGNLLAYAEKIEKYANIYGDQVWHLIYQADVKMRRDHFERLRRQGRDELADALQINPQLDLTSFPYVDQRPWNYVFSKATNAATWWKEELEDPAMLVLNDVASQSRFLSDDIAIDQPKSKKPKTSYDSGGSAHYNAERQGKGMHGSVVKAAVKGPPGHYVSSDGLTFLANRSNVELCRQYNAGACGGPHGGHRCPVDNNRFHACNKCLGPHPACNVDGRDNPCQSEPKPPSSTRMKGGKSKGKGKSQK